MNYGLLSGQLNGSSYVKRNGRLEVRGGMTTFVGKYLIRRVARHGIVGERVLLYDFGV